MITKENLKIKLTRLRRIIKVFYLKTFKTLGKEKRLKKPKKTYRV